MSELKIQCAFGLNIFSIPHGATTLERTTEDISSETVVMNSWSQMVGVLKVLSSEMDLAEIRLIQ